MTQIKDIF